MPISFDFRNSSTFTITTSAVGPHTFSFNDTDSAGGGQTVTFTVSSDAAGGAEFIRLSGLRNLTLDDADFVTAGTAADDVFTLTFVDIANPVNTQISGTINNPIGLQFGNVFVGSVRVQLLDGTAVLSTRTFDASDANASPTFSAASINGIRFTTAGSAFDRITVIGLTGNGLNCFLEGTMIATPGGEVPVERLAAGDIVRTKDGRAVAARWVGHQTIDTRVTHPATVNPICISAGALAEGVPERDLCVSPDHAVEVDGYLINAGALVNGESIYQVRNMPLDGFTYYHIETEAHELLIADGVAAESFLDYSDTFGFDNADERSQRVIPEMDLPRISSARLVPDVIAARLSERARELRVWRRAG